MEYKLITNEDFDSFHKGDFITDQALVQAILNGPNAHHVSKVIHYPSPKVEPEKAKPPQPIKSDKTEE